MLSYIFALSLFLIAACSVLLRKSYAVVPQHELRRQAATGNDLAKHLYRAVGYGQSLQTLLWIVTVVASATGIVLFASKAGVVVSIIVSVLIISLVFIWLPRSRVSGVAMTVTKTLTPTIVWILAHTGGGLRLTSSLINRYRLPRHSGLYELEDLLDLLALQSDQADSRITAEEIELIRGVIAFKDKKVHDVMRPRKRVKTVNESDAIGPVLLDELHASGQTVFPVKRSSRSKEIVASLHLGDVGIHSTGTVIDYAHQGTVYINESDSLADALHGFFQTKQQLVVVIDSEQAYVGVLTLEDMLHSLVGRPLPDEQLGHHDEPAAVAARHDDETVVE